jgi:hypothetical protein
MPGYSFDLFIEPPDDGEIDEAALRERLRQFANDVANADVIDFAFESDSGEGGNATERTFTEPLDPTQCDPKLKALARIRPCPPRFDNQGIYLPKGGAPVETQPNA